MIFEVQHSSCSWNLQCYRLFKYDFFRCFWLIFAVLSQTVVLFLIRELLSNYVNKALDGYRVLLPILFHILRFKYDRFYNTGQCGIPFHIISLIVFEDSISVRFLYHNVGIYYSELSYAENDFTVVDIFLLFLNIPRKDYDVWGLSLLFAVRSR